MRIGYKKVHADEGKRLVLTSLGYEATADRVKPERAIGEPVKGYEKSVPKLWYDKGWIEEAEK